MFLTKSRPKRLQPIEDLPKNHIASLKLPFLGWFGAGPVLPLVELVSLAEGVLLAPEL